MRNKIIFTLLLSVLFVNFQAIAQTPKLGYTNLDYILAQLPESKQIESQLKDFSAQLQKQLQSKYSEYEQKLDAYKKSQATMAEIVKQDKEQELINLQNSIHEFETNAQTEMQKKQGSLLQPVLDKVQKAINKVAEANGYTYIFSTHSDGGSAIILYAKNKEDNISDLVLKELGVTPAALPDSTEQATPQSGTPLRK